MDRTDRGIAPLLTPFLEPIFVKRPDGRARLLCDGATLREGGEVKGKQDRERVSPLRATPTQKPADRSELCTPRVYCKRMWTHPLRPYTQIVFCACDISL
jgi:hypothetical protein